MTSEASGKQSYRFVSWAILGIGGVALWQTGAWAWGEMQRASAHSNVYDALVRQKHAWNEGKLEAFMAEYWQSDDLTFYSGGTVTKGWQATLDRYRKRYQAEGKEMGTLDFEDITVNVLASDAAVVRGRWKLVTSKDKPDGLFTLMFRKIDGKWVIVHDHTSAADPPKPAEVLAEPKKIP